MTRLVIALLLLQTSLTAQTAPGIVTGVVRNAGGQPQPNVRVAAMAPPAQTAGANVLVTISRTDEAGRYRLEVPPGEFFITAGRVDRPTYYPNSMEPATAKAIQVRAGSTLDGIDVSAAADSLVVPVSRASASNPARTVIASLPPTPLLPYLTGYSAAQAPKLIFEYITVIGRTAFFKTDSGSSFSYSCSACAFFVRYGGVGTQTTDPGMLVKVDPSGQSLEFTCVASRCPMAQFRDGRIVVSAIDRNQSRVIMATDQVGFAIIP